VREAHAADEWPLGQHSTANAHQSLEQRVGAARVFVDRHSVTIPVGVDGMADGFMLTFKAHPERFYIFRSGAGAGSADAGSAGAGSAGTGRIMLVHSEPPRLAPQLLYKAMPSNGGYSLDRLRDALQKLHSRD
jgi:hypothetical protein